MKKQQPAQSQTLYRCRGEYSPRRKSKQSTNQKHIKNGAQKWCSVNEKTKELIASQADMITKAIDYIDEDSFNHMTSIAIGSGVFFMNITKFDLKNEPEIMLHVCDGKRFWNSVGKTPNFKNRVLDILNDEPIKFELLPINDCMLISGKTKEKTKDGIKEMIRLAIVATMRIRDILYKEKP